MLVDSVKAAGGEVDQRQAQNPLSQSVLEQLEIANLKIRNKQSVFVGGDHVETHAIDI